MSGGEVRNPRKSLFLSRKKRRKLHMNEDSLSRDWMSELPACYSQASFLHLLEGKTEPVTYLLTNGI
jgi:hypothetical protein